LLRRVVPTLLGWLVRTLLGRLAVLRWSRRLLALRRPLRRGRLLVRRWPELPRLLLPLLLNSRRLLSRLLLLLSGRGFLGTRLLLLSRWSLLLAVRLRLLPLLLLLHGRLLLGVPVLSGLLLGVRPLRRVLGQRLLGVHLLSGRLLL
jgi:hypothetical protein